MPCFFLVELRLVVFLTKTMRLVPRTVKSLRSNDLSLIELQEQIQVLLSLPQRWRRKPTRWDSNGFRLTKTQKGYTGNILEIIQQNIWTLQAPFGLLFGIVLDSCWNSANNIIWGDVVELKGGCHMIEPKRVPCKEERGADQ